MASGRRVPIRLSVGSTDEGATGLLPASTFSSE